MATAHGIPLLLGVGDELRAIVHPQMNGRWVELEQLLNRVDNLSSPAAPGDSNSQEEATVLIDHLLDLRILPSIFWSRWK